MFQLIPVDPVVTLMSGDLVFVLSADAVLCLLAREL